MTEVAVVGGGIAGCATAALLAERGAAVTLYEREAIGAGASGRNSGILQHPLDPLLVPLFEASLELYDSLGHGFTMPREPTGAIVLSRDPGALRRDYEDAAAAFPELAPEWLDEAALRRAEPCVAPGLVGYRVADGRPVGPTTATRAWAARAEAAGARLEIGAAARAVPGGVEVGGRRHGADVVVVAAGPWTAEACGLPLPVSPLWGVVAQVRLPSPPRHALEEAGIETLTRPDGGPAELFSLITTADGSAVGSTFSVDEPDPARVAPSVVERAAAYVPALADARIESVRACARPLSADGRPLLGQTAIEGLHVVTGHGAWGMTLAPGSARLVVEALAGEREIPPELAATRF